MGAFDGVASYIDDSPTDKWAGHASSIAGTSAQDGSQNNGYLSRVSSDLSKIDAKQQAEADKYSRGEQGEYVTRAQIALRELSKASPPIREAITSVLSMAPDLIGDEKRAMIKPVKDAVNGAYQWAREPSKWAREGVAKEHPIIADTLGAAKDAAGGVLDLATAGGGAKTLGLDMGAGDALKAITPDIHPVPRSSDVFNEAGKAYKDLESAGASVDAGGVNNFLKGALQKVVTDSKVAGAIGKSEATKYLTTGGESGDGLLSLKNQPITIQQVHAIDKDLTQKINKHFSDGLDQSGNELMELQDTFRKHFMTPNHENVTGGMQGFDAWNQANHLYHTGSKMEQIENVVDNAKYTQNPATTIQTGLRNILKSAKKTRGYSDEEIAALEKAAINGLTADSLRTFGGRLMTGVGATLGAGMGGLATGGPIGALLGAAAGGGGSFIGGRMLRGGAEAVQASGAKKLIRVMTKDGYKYMPESAAAAPSIQDPLLLADRGDAARFSDAKQDALQRYNQGRTGGAKQDLPQSGPMVGRPDGDVPYNYYSPPNETKLLTGPQSARPMSSSEIEEAKRSINKKFPLKPASGVPHDYGDVPYNYIGVKPISREQINSLFGEEWNKIDEAHKLQLEKQINEMWETQKIPMSDTILQARKSASELAAAKGDPFPVTQMGEALTNAQIAKLPPAEATDYLKRIKNMRKP